MSNLTLTKTRLFEGVWEGILTRASSGRAAPKIEVRHEQNPLDGVSVIETDDEKVWSLRVPIPASVIADGVQTFLIVDAETGTTLDSFSLMSGEALSYDIRVELGVLREELDLLKRAFRRHCLETM